MGVMIYSFFECFRIHLQSACPSKATEPRVLVQAIDV
jgi:hypothetical protein